ncbi:flagellar motor switch protein FliM [Pseudobacteriovorax antillogorgiicola]|uniref:Flagellar motor switch protein FliM n=1 Tax=Pseudobacteriovorax antillogorgiicola TaxID=1513793 RepID=A0A1Y6CIE0_9BACT|nr:flagellar motor switch protein FliM [Pseudobacteriovorax antillogorgiicola]TCS46663.1 flagellar motor switch protein FliM [Pseudobacteriovorax antillogorgiicola]SMF66542.1 flagellar motor switch protein FliM [Pseudobacteriovorax antillogorgiicola]
MSQVLSQSEVDALLSAVSDNRVDADDDGGDEGLQSGVVQYDLANQDRIIRGRMPTLDIIHDRFIRLFRVTLSNSLRKMANLSVNSTGPLKFSEFMNSLPLPSCLNILRLDPLRGAAVMVIESKLLYALVDSFFGGNDVPYTKIEGKDFTQIEIKIARRVVLSAIDDLEKAWEPVYPLKIGYSRTEINPQFVAVVPPSDVVIATTFDVELEKVSGTIKIVIPYSTLEPIKSKLSVGFQSEQLEVDFIWINRVKEQIMQTTANLVVKLGEANIQLRDIMNLEIGDIIQLDTDATMPLDVLVEGVPKFKGIPGLLKGNRAIRVTESMFDL